MRAKTRVNCRLVDDNASPDESPLSLSAFRMIRMDGELRLKRAGDDSLLLW